MEERLQKILSRAGISSRRKAEELITQGVVSVNDHVITELGSKADFERDRIRVNGRLINKPTERLYFMLNKPRGYITSTQDPEGRPTVIKLLGRVGSKVYPVGRLDYASEGLLLLTNDGDFANRVMSAKEKLPKSYLVKVNGMLDHKSMEQFREGVYIDGRRTAPAELRLTVAATNPWYEVVLTEGRNRQIRNMFLRFGLLVEKLKRTRIGPLSLGKLASGDYRPLTPREIERVLAAPTEAPRNERRKSRPDPKPRPNNRRRRVIR